MTKAQEKIKDEVLPMSNKVSLCFQFIVQHYPVLHPVLSECQKHLQEMTSKLWEMLPDDVSLKNQTELEETLKRMENLLGDFIRETEFDRVEVIDKEGRAYTKRNAKIRVSSQDDGKTLKIFVD